MLPAKAADNLYWFGRYVERAEATVRVVRSMVVEVRSKNEPVKGGAQS